MSSDAISIIGTRSFAGEIVDYAEAAGLDVRRLLEPFDRTRVGTTVHGCPVEWLDDAGPCPAVVATGERSRREIVARATALGLEAVTLVHPAAHVSARAAVGHGAVVGPAAVVGAFSTIGEHALVARGVLVGHHTDIGAFATLNPGVNVAGNVSVGADTFFGMGSIVFDHVVIGEQAVVAAGAVVRSDVTARSVVRPS